ncbi:NAD(P)-dependent oxidoreductase [Bowmanella denitrificans]|uniref:NAD(P)-dependent oxidoreductase n=1 Tax=Bowmanella denitrificans TaxID=366582 RepID=A0ABP3GIX9_9ALTE
MKVALLGASGWIGSQLAIEAKARGHQVRALVRNPQRLKAEVDEVQQFDLENPQNLAQAIGDAEVLLVSVGGRAAGKHQMVPATARLLLEQLPGTNIKRLLWVGGAGSLEVAPGVSLLSTEGFPVAYQDEAQAQGEALAIFRSKPQALEWTYISPAADIFPGERLGEYRVGKDNLLTDEQGNSRISVQDYAKAMLDEVEQKRFANQRIGVAY